MVRCCRNNSHAGDQPLKKRTAAAFALAVAAPAWPLSAQSGAFYEQTYLRAPHNWVFRSQYPGVSGLFNAFDYGHAILSETLWRWPSANKAALDDVQFGFITTKLLVNPPDVILDEAAIGPGWAKLAPEVLMMFEWAHMLHRQLYDVWADERIAPADKDSRVAEVLAYYKSRRELAFSSRPKSMDLMEGQSYSLAFRRRFPKYNGLIWSYHWMQMALYDALMAGTTARERRTNVDAVVARFRQMLRDPGALPSVMPMSPVIAPRFTERYPEASIIFDNLHSLHDVVSDILADPKVPRSAKRATILAAAARYRDSVSSVTSVEEWMDMADAMGVERMGGLPPVRTPADTTSRPPR